MSVCLPNTRFVLAGITTSKSFAGYFDTGSLQRLPTDPFYYADVVIENIVVGSAYILGYTPAGGEFTSLGFSGIVPGTPGEKTTITLSSVPSYATVMLLELRVRKSSEAQKYLPLKQFANHSPNGTNMYLAQIPDDIAAA